jgi:hypothetical protein
MGIWHYGDSIGTPTTAGWTYVDECVDPQLTPHIVKTVGAANIQKSEDVSVATFQDTNWFVWTMNGTSMVINWEDPVGINLIVRNWLNLNRHFYRSSKARQSLATPVTSLYCQMLVNGYISPFQQLYLLRTRSIFMVTTFTFWLKAPAHRIPQQC